MKFLVVGGGSIGRRHIRNLFALGGQDITACDINSDRASQANRELEIAVFLFIEEAVEARPDVALVHAGRSTQIHPACLGARAGCRSSAHHPKTSGQCAALFPRGTFRLRAA